MEGDATTGIGTDTVTVATRVEAVVGGMTVIGGAEAAL